MKKSPSTKRNTATTEASKSGAVRSRAYPAVDLKSAIQLVNRQVQGLGDDAHSREVIAQSLGHAKSSGPAARKIAAMSHFGLLERSNGLYKPTPLAKKLLNSDSAQVSASRREAFLKPTVFQEVVNAHRPAGRLPALLGPALGRSHGISESVQEEVATIFRESGVFAGMLTPDGEFIGPRPAPVDPTRELPYPEHAEAVPSPASHTEDHQTINIHLTYGEAKIQLPSRVTLSDFRKLQTLLSAFEPVPKASSKEESNRFSRRDV